MERMFKGWMASITFLLVTIVSCDKNERAYKRFIDEGRWAVTELSAGTTLFTKLPDWQIYPCDDHENYCLATWEHQNESTVDFYWKFSNLGGDFDFYADSATSDTQSMAFSQCVNFSGMYDVKESKRRLFRFESYTTFGYPDKLVTIVLERE